MSAVLDRSLCARCGNDATLKAEGKPFEPCPDCPTGHAVAAELDAIRREQNPSGSWVMYRPTDGGDLLQAAGMHGRWDNHTDPGVLAANVLANYADDQPTWVVKVFDQDDKLVAWAEWNAGAPVARYHAAKQVRPR